ncbi:hypothetical protein VTH82DRAFT_8607 [Thermothelomyces myriococcoides]
MSSSATLPINPKPSCHPPDMEITRVALSNGYRAYHPKNADSKEPPEQKKRVRFVKGHVIIPDIPHCGYARPPSKQPRGAAVSILKNTNNNNSSKEIVHKLPSQANNRKLVNLPLRVASEKRQQPQQRQQQKHVTAGTYHKPAGAKPEPARALWRKRPRFRGSGFVRVLDDPVAHGRELAAETSSVRLPSDRWRDPPPHVREPRRLEEEDDDDDYYEERAGRLPLRYEDGERDAAFSLDDLVRERQPAYVVRVVVASAASRCSRKKVRSVVEVDGGDKEKGEKEVSAAADEAGRIDAEAQFEQGEDSDVFLALSETSSYLESEEEEEEYDFVRDFQIDEDDGWVPVMVAEEEKGDDWMSLTGTWMRLGGILEAFK